MTVEGTIAGGSEPGCVELMTETDRYVLLGELAAGLGPGEDVEVVGVYSPNAATECHGTPLRVSEVRHR